MLSAVESGWWEIFFPVPLDTALIFDKTQCLVNSWLPRVSYNALNNGVDVNTGQYTTILTPWYNTENIFNMMPIKAAALTLVQLSATLSLLEKTGFMLALHNASLNNPMLALIPD